MKRTRVLTAAAAFFFCLLPASFSAVQTRQINHDPEMALITAADVTVFWRAYDLWLSRDHGDADKLAGVLQSEYLDKGSQGVKDFIPDRIVSAQNLARAILRNRSYYENARQNMGKMEQYIPQIRKSFLELKRLYPDASFPAVYFVVGARTSGGTSSRSALIIGAEMFGDNNSYPVHLDNVVPMVAHELVHFQQKGNDDSLLKAAMREGAADFIAELVAGRHINESAKPYGDSHEQELWQRFQKDVNSGAPVGTWMYDGTPKPDGAPPDLGYYMGYKISQSYYQLSSDKKQALTDIIEMRSPADILAKSGYGKRFN